MGAIGMVAGTAGVVESTSGQGPHSWENVVSGVVSGATATAGAAAFVNAIPVGGQIGYTAAIVTGAVVGGLISGSQLFSETDCLTDPVTKKFTCCNTAFNRGERYANIGDYMFCGVEKTKGQISPVKYGVRQCLQGGSAKEADWFSGLFLDDAWSPECKERLCSGVKKPDSEDGVQWYGDTKKICWEWACVNGYSKSGNRCVSNKKSATPAKNTGSTNKQQANNNNPDAAQYDATIAFIEDEIRKLQTTCGITE